MTNHQNSVLALIKSISGQSNVLTIPRLFIDLLNNDLAAALLLSQCTYWSDRTQDPDGWFYKSYSEWEREIGLSQFKISRAASMLSSRGLLEVKRKRAKGAPTLHYRVAFENLTNSIIKFLDNRESRLSRNSTMDYQETSLSDYEVSQQSLGGKASQLNNELETTAEITTEITAESGAGAPRRRQPKKPPAQKSADDPREQLRIDATEGGRILVGCYERLFHGLRRRVPEYYANSGQRDAFLRVFEALGGELHLLIEKGFARERVRRSDILAWLEACVERNRVAKAPPGSSPGISEADLIAAGYRRHEPGPMKQPNEPAGFAGIRAFLAKLEHGQTEDPNGQPD